MKRKRRECWVWWDGNFAIEVRRATVIGMRLKPLRREFADEDGVVQQARGRWVLMREVKTRKRGEVRRAR